MIVLYLQGREKGIFSDSLLKVIVIPHLWSKCSSKCVFLLTFFVRFFFFSPYFYISAPTL